MKINRFAAMAAIALLVVGAMGAITARSFAQTPVAPAAQNQVTEAPENANGPDTDNVEEQVGDQNAPDTGTEANAGIEAAGAEDGGPDEQAPLYPGSLTLDPSKTEGMSEADEAAALAGQAKITVEEASAAALAANPGATVVKAELDNENGALVYSVELSNGADVKVDAGNGAILHTETGGDNEG